MTCVSRFVLMTFSLNVFSAVAATMYEPYDAWLKLTLFLQFKKMTYGVAEYWWSADAAGCAMDVAQS